MERRGGGRRVGPGQTVDGYRNDFIANFLQTGVVLKYRCCSGASKGNSPCSRSAHTCCSRDPASVNFLAVSLPSALRMEGQTPSLAIPLKITVRLCCQSTSHTPHTHTSRTPFAPPHGFFGEKPIWPVVSDEAETSPQGVELRGNQQSSLSC